MHIDWQPFLLTFKLAGLTTLFLLIITLPLAWWLAHTKSKIKPVVEALVSLPLVLPPSVLGFYLLVTFSPASTIGHFLIQTFGLHLIFSFPGLVFASVIYSFPFMVHPLQRGLEVLPASLLEAAYTLGKSKMQAFFQVVLPNMKAAVISGIVLSFAHTIGEFGVVLMIGGNLPGETKVASIAIYDEVEQMHYGTANYYSLALLAICFSVLLLVYSINKKNTRSF
jgi:molybdate transport system permease protein